MKKLLITLSFFCFHIHAIAKGNNNNFNCANAKGDTLFGTLVLPSTSIAKVTVVFLIAGSGPTDRDCNSIAGVKSDAFKMLADSLSQAGIASIRFDKRGVGDSKAAGTTEEELRFDDMVNDAVAYLKKIKSDNRFGKIIIAGHSEGSLIGMLAAQKEKVDGYISIAGPGENASKIISKQLKKQAPQLSEEVDSIIEALRQKKLVTLKTQNLNSIFRPSVQPYLISWFAYDPQIEIKKLNIPVLIIQGNTDLQVTVKDAEMLKTAMPAAKMTIIDQMNHVLKTVSADPQENVASYNKPDMPIDSDFCMVMIGFCKR